MAEIPFPTTWDGAETQKIMVDKLPTSTGVGFQPSTVVSGLCGSLHFNRNLSDTLLATCRKFICCARLDLRTIGSNCCRQRTEKTHHPLNGKSQRSVCLLLLLHQFFVFFFGEEKNIKSASRHFAVGKYHTKQGHESDFRSFWSQEIRRYESGKFSGTSNKAVGAHARIWKIPKQP